MNDYQILDTDAESIDSCSLCGNTHAGNLGRCRKASWLKDRFAEGLWYKVLRSGAFGDVGMIEYAPGEHAWQPVAAEGYLVIYCLMVSGRQHKGKGLGALLLDSCLRDAKESQCRGVAVVTSSDSFMAGNDLFLKAGFVSVDRIPPYELLVKELDKTAPDPRFTVEKAGLLERYGKGLTILAADQCPYVAKTVARIVDACKTLGLEPRVARVETAEASRELPTPYGVFCIVYDGEVVAERPISATRFMSIMRGVSKPDATRSPGPTTSS